MSTADKAGNTADKLIGKAKEAVGKVTDNERLEAEGQAQQSKADLKQGGEKVKDAFRQD
ncbi:CsbD family protein [Aquipuribacter sp. SD81]|uniref:CsbD family protein n=1 Tax=Aquipuribacter sp. SD81 TaxID=3127703 RepID=UPI00301AA6D6